MLTARDIMTEEVVTIHPSATVASAIELLMAEQISGLPVVDDQGRLVGIVTEFALLAVAYDGSIAHDPVSQHMTSEVLTVDIDDTARKVADLFIVHRVRRAPVMAGDRIVGLISRRDVLRAVYGAQIAPESTGGAAIIR